MNIAGTTAAAVGQVQTAQDLLVLKKVMDAQKMEGRAALQLIAAVPVAPPPPSGTGTLVDVRA
jgi:hypothetical protein